MSFTSIRFRDVPIQRKLMLLIMVTTTLALGISGLGLVVADSVLFRRNLARDLNTLSQIVADNSTAALAFEDPKSASDTLAALRARTHLVDACIYRADGTTLASYRRPDALAHCPPPAQVAQTITSGGDILVSHPILLAGRRIGTLVLLYDLGDIAERTKLYGLLVFSVLLTTALITFLVSSRLSRIIAKPIAELAHVTTAVSSTRDYSIRAERVSGDELGVLVDGFNAMLARVQLHEGELQRALFEREEALRQAQRARDSLETTLASIGDAVISADVEGCVVFANRVAQTLLRTSQADLAGKHLEKVFRVTHDSARTQPASPVAKILEEAFSTGIANDMVLIAPGGVETPIDLNAAPIRDATGAVQGTVLVFRDVTARRKADETSRLLASIVESSDDAIIGHDLTGLITSWNKGAERVFGYSAPEMLGRRTGMIAPPDRPDEMPEVLGRIARGERVEQYQAQRSTKSGRLIDVSITVSPVHDALGRIAGASKIARDITEQVRAAERLAQLNTDLRRSNENLARSNEDLERFAFIASHDLQEPLRMITIYSQLLIRECVIAPDANTTMYLENVVGGTKRMRELLSDLLAYTGIGAQNEEPKADLDLNQVLEKALQNLRASLDETGAVVTSDHLPALKAHEAHFVPLFQNLIANAIKYRSEKSPRIRISVEQANGNMRFAVADNGIGIARDYHAKIFVAFKRLHGNSIPGTGIGLAICQRVVERYGGRIWVESELGQGAEFVFTLPSQLFRDGAGDE